MRALKIVMLSLFMMSEADAGPGARWVSGTVSSFDAESVIIITKSKVKVKVLRKFFNPKQKIEYGKPTRVFVHAD